MKLSFIIITNGKNIDKLRLQVRSILNQNIPQFEIIVVGTIAPLEYCSSPEFFNCILLEDQENAERGYLGGLRNTACKIAIGDYFVISDDDMLFSKDWYENFLKIPFNCDIMTPCVKVPDGTRFWDNCCYMSPTRGHIILNPGEYDSHLYMSGGQSWIMARHVFDKVQWDGAMPIYEMKNLEDYHSGKHNEDTNFSLRCREAGFKIKHNHFMLVYHNDDTYTSVGRIVFRRPNGLNWCENLETPENYVKDIVDQLKTRYLNAEDLDIFRKAERQDIIDQIETQLGGKLYNSKFNFDNQEYKELIELYG